jgi:Uma2 family endonuclease
MYATKQSIGPAMPLEALNLPRDSYQPLLKPQCCKREPAMSVKRQATIEELYKVDGKAELVNGEIVLMPPTGDEPGSAAFEIAASLREYAHRMGRGRAYPDGVGFHVNLPHRELFSPDAAYYVGPRTGMRFLEGAPYLCRGGAQRR